jgi:hypothetical protein
VETNSQEFAPLPLEVPVEIPMEPVGLEPAHEAEVAPQPIEVDHASHRDTVQIAPATDPALDTSMHRESHADVSVAIDPALDTSMHRDTSEVAHAVDPALVTDPSEMASAFPTNFGVANATIDPVGVAADVPGLYEDHSEVAAVAAEATVDVAPVEASAVDAASAEEPQSGWRAEEHHLEDHEHGVRLEHEMAQHYAAQVAVAEPEPAPPAAEPTGPAVAAAAAAQTNAPDMQFAAAMAAAVGAEAPAANSADGTIAMDPEMIARVVQRVTERMRPDLIAEITKELMMERQKNKK